MNGRRPISIFRFLRFDLFAVGYAQLHLITYTFVYDDAENPFYRYAEYQFWDVDNDGEDELLLGFYGGGPHGITLYETYEMADSGLVSKSLEFDEHSHFNLKK